MSVILNSRHLPVMKLVPCIQRTFSHAASSSSLFTETFFPSVQCLQARTFKSNLKIKWVRPPKIPCIDPVKSGDLEPAAEVDTNQLPPEFEKVEASKDISDLAKRILSLDFRHANVTAKVARDEMVDSVKVHNLDKTSDEAVIAEMTARIRSLQRHMEQFPRDKKNKVVLKEMIDRRKKRLKFLRAKDYKRFEWLLEKLQLEYRPPPDFFYRVTRKDSLRKLTAQHCTHIRRQRLYELRRSFEEQKPIFLQEKAEKLSWIRQQELECGVEPSVSEEDILKVQQQLKELEAARAVKAAQQQKTDKAT
ncbi:28S ribosomal protein S15, mitochondrial [Schistocerca serialis cubense]|uniref:28S ribosomal protein S15, mitochondrial n=1 Tax=Schistocerca serialis cubense TaxID=2023355 RepID=UPI00214E9F46|nr:28S ribosomal protein S15, mitochondrial [Schistocerca serialis cubense]